MHEVALLPPSEATEGDMAYFRDRLEDLTLIGAAVAVRVDGFVSLAVPTGGHRLGGFVSLGQITSALAVRRALTGRPGFSDVRVRWAQYIDVCHAVQWGARVPFTDDDVIRGRFYGYRPEAIDRFLTEHSVAPDVPALSALIDAHNRRGSASA